MGEARQRYFSGTGGPVAPLTESCPVAADGRLGSVPEAARERFWVSREELEALIDEAVKSAKVR